MTREKFHASLSLDEKQFWKEMSEKFGKLKYEGEKATEGVVIKDVKPDIPYRCHWYDGLRGKK